MLMGNYNCIQQGKRLRSIRKTYGKTRVPFVRSPPRYLKQMVCLVCVSATALGRHNEETVRAAVYNRVTYLLCPTPLFLIETEIRESCQK
jgi:predicted ATPase